MPNPYTTRGPETRMQLRSTPDVQTGAQQTNFPQPVKPSNMVPVKS